MKTEKNTDWISVEKELPKEDGEYLVSLKKGFGVNRSYVDIAYFAQDLCAIDDHDFQDKKGISGFYKYSWNGGVCEVKPTSWHPLPERRDNNE